MTLLGIDYGTSRIGIALSKGDIVTPIETVKTKIAEFSIQKIARYCIENKVERIVIGLPLTVDGKETAFAREVKRFGKQVKVRTKKPVTYHNEFGSSNTALADAIDYGISQKNRRVNDHLAAAVILREYISETT